MRSECAGSNRTGPKLRRSPIDNRAAPARDDRPTGPPGIEPGPARLELAVLPFTPRAFESGRPGSNGPLRVEPGALPSELRPQSSTPGWNRTSGLCRRRAALSPLSYGRREEPPAGVEPAPRPYKGRVLAVDTTEARRWRRRESNPLLLGASEALFHLSYIPKVRTGGVEPPQREAAGLQPVELTDAQRPQGVTGRARTGAAGLTTPDASLYTTATTKRGRPDLNRRPLA